MRPRERRLLGAFMRPDEVRSVQSIAMSLENLARAEPCVQEDLFGGPVQLAPTPYGDYYANLAARICRTALTRLERAA